MKNMSLGKSDKNSRHGRKHGTARLFVLSAAFAAATGGTGVVRAHAQTPPAAAQGGTAQGGTAQGVPFNIQPGPIGDVIAAFQAADRKSTRLNSSHGYISYAVFCLKKKKQTQHTPNSPNNKEG